MNSLADRIFSKQTVCSGIGAIWLLALCSCQTTSVPVVTPAMAAVGTGKVATVTSLQNGRSILTTRCIACHGVQPLGKYSNEQWKGYVDTMAPRAKLSESEKQDLLAYISAAKNSVQ